MRGEKVSFKEEKGAVLFLVILFTAALLLLGTAFLRIALQERLTAGNYAQKLRAQYLAEAGMEAALTLLKEQPDYFLLHGSSGPVYLQAGPGPEGEYFQLEWLEPGNPAGHQKYHTLKAYGMTRSTFEQRQARAEISALLRLDRSVDESGVEELSVCLLRMSGR